MDEASFLMYRSTERELMLINITLAYITTVFLSCYCLGGKLKDSSHM